MKKRMAALVLTLALTLAAGLARCDVPEYAVGTEVAGFRLESADEIAAAHSTLFTWRHLATGAQLCHVANDNRIYFSHTNRTRHFALAIENRGILLRPNRRAKAHEKE